MLFDPKIKPRLWNLRLGTVVHNCAWMGLPVPAFLAPFWMFGDKLFESSGNNHVGIIGSSMSWQGQGLKGGNTYNDANNIIDFDSTIDPRTWPGITVFVYGDFETPDNEEYPSLVTNMISGEYYGNYNLSYEHDAGGSTIYWRPGNNSIGITHIITLGDHQSVTATWVKNGTGTIYVNGRYKTSGIRSSGWNINNYDTHINGYYRSLWRTNSNTYKAVIIFPIVLNAVQVATLSNNPFGLLEPIRDYRIWSFVSGGVFYKTITGNMPTSTGNIASVGNYKQTIVGDMPTTVATIAKRIDTQIIGNVPTPVAVVIKRTAKELTGDQLNPTGSVVPVSIYKQSTAGDVPATVGIVVKGVEKDVAGNVPTPVAGITKKISIQVAGTLPTSTAIVVKKTEKELVGTQPNPAGDVTHKSVYKQSATGDIPNPIGSLGSTIKTVLVLAGNMPTSLGNAIKKISKMLSGNSPTAIGNITKQTEKNVAGEQPAPTGSVSHTTKTFLSGIMGNITGILDTVLNPMAPTAVKLCKLIGSCFKKFLG